MVHRFVHNDSYELLKYAGEHYTQRKVFMMKRNVFLVMAFLALMAAVVSAQTDLGGTPGLKFTLLKGVNEYSVEKGKVKTGAVVIPESYNNVPVTTIAKKAFSSSTITGITIPNSIKSIGDQAFKSCKNLTDITIPDSVITIGKEAFDGCKNLTGIIIPDSVITIGEEAFEDCKSLASVTIGNGVTSIGKQAFNDCTGLTSVTIGNSVTSIEQMAFGGCGFTSVTIPNSVKNIGWWAFAMCTSLTSVTFAGNNAHFDNLAFAEGQLGLGGNSLWAAYCAYTGGAGKYTRPSGGDPWRKQW